MAYVGNDAILDLYSAYKTSTKYVLDWLQSRRRPRPATRHAQFKTTMDIIGAAQETARENGEVPGSVISALRHSIMKRRAVLQIYREDAEANATSNESSDKGHESFINRLETVLQILLPLQTNTFVTTTTRPLSPGTSNLDIAENRFTALSLLEASDLPGDENPAVGVRTLAQTETVISARRRDSSTLDEDGPSGTSQTVLEDDEIGEWIELSFFIYEIDSILSRVNSFWNEAASGCLPIPLAALLSTTAVHAVGRSFRRLESIAPDHATLQRKWLQHKMKGVRIRFTAIPDLESQIGGRFFDGSGIYHSAMLLHHCRTSDEYEQILSTAGSYQNPHKTIGKPKDGYVPTDDDRNNRVSHGDEFQQDDLALDRMQESMRQLLLSKRGIAAIEVSEEAEHISEPLIPLLRHMLDDPSSTIPIHYVFGMELLLSSYKSFIWNDGKPNKQNCRILALKFAKDVQRAMSTAVSTLGAKSGPTSIIEWKILTFLNWKIEALDKYTHEQRFDLYYQAPWTAGCHIVEILDCAFADGLSICTGLGYVCAVLHLYNALRQLQPPLKRINLLDDLCQVFLSPLFLGKLPKENFSSNYRRAMGARLRQTSDVSHRSKPKLVSPPTASTRRTQPSTMSLFMELHGTYYQPTADFWVRIHNDRGIQRPNQKQRLSAIEAVHSRPFTAALDMIKSAALPEFDSELPTMRINYFSIFTFCCQLLQQLSEKVHENPGTTSRGNTLHEGFASVDEMLEAIVRHLRDPNLTKIMRYWRELRIVRSVFEGLDDKLALSEHLWSI